MKAPLSRRRFLQISALGAAVGAVPLGGRAIEDLLRPPSGSAGVLVGLGESDGPFIDRPGPNALVVIELSGGHDGFSTIVPTTDPTYRRLRTRTRVDHTIEIGDGFGWHPNLARTAARGAAAVLGVGVAHPDLSHFEMLSRWWAGAPDGAATTAATGFLGRLCDELATNDAPAVGVSIADAPTPALVSSRAPTLFLASDGDDTLPVPTDSDDATRGWRAFAQAATNSRGEDATFATARAGMARGLRFGGEVDSLPEAKVKYPDTDIAQQLHTTGRLLSIAHAPRIVHVPWGSFDTHSGHNDAHASQLADLDAALDAFQRDLGHRGLAHRVVIATTSEFGRRAADNGSDGLDHGTASNLLIAGGSVRKGLHGRPVRFDRLDADGNVHATLSMSDYYATLAQWLDVDPDHVLPQHSRPIAGLLNPVYAQHAH